MPYAADISRNNPGCLLFLIDQSASMSGALGGQPELRKMDGAADAVNRILEAISQRCSQGMDVRDYFHVGVITYTTDGKGDPDVQSALPGTTAGEPFLTISQVVDAAIVEERKVKESDGAGDLVLARASLVDGESLACTHHDYSGQPVDVAVLGESEYPGWALNCGGTRHV